MSEPAEEAIRQRAYELWEAAGRPDAGHEEYWLEAERQLRNAPESKGETSGPAGPDRANPAEATETDPPAPGGR